MWINSINTLSMHERRSPVPHYYVLLFVCPQIIMLPISDELKRTTAVSVIGSLLFWELTSSNSFFSFLFASFQQRKTDETYPPKKSKKRNIVQKVNHIFGLPQLRVGPLRTPRLDHSQLQGVFCTHISVWHCRTNSTCPTFLRNV